MLLIAGLLIFSIFFSILAWKHPSLALCFIILTLPSYLIRFKLGSLPMTALELMILILFATWFIKTTKDHAWSTITFSKYDWLIGLLLVVSLISAIISTNHLSALGLWKAYFVEPIMFFLVFINTIKKKEQWQWVITAIGLSALLVAIPAIIQKFTGLGITNPFWQAEATRRVVSWYGFPNAVGLYLAPITMLYIGLLVSRIYEFLRMYKSTGKIRLDWWIAFAGLVVACSTLAIVWAQTEGAIVGLAAGIIILGLFYPNKKLRIATAASLVTLVALVSLACPESNSRFWFWVTPIRNYAIEKGTLSDTSGQIRQEQWHETIAMLKDGREIFGAGLSNYQFTVAPYHKAGIDITANGKTFWQPTEIYMYPHNIILNFWSELGLPGVLLFLALIILFSWSSHRLKNPANKKYYLILIATLVVILVHGIVDVPYFKNDLSLFWWLLFALSIFVTKQKKVLEY